MRRAMFIAACVLLTASCKSPAPASPPTDDAAAPAPAADAEPFKMAFVQRHAGECAAVLASPPPMHSARARAWALLCASWEDDREKAIERARTWIREQPDDAWARFALASLYSLDPGTFDAAKQELRRVGPPVAEADLVWLRVRMLLNAGDDLAAREVLDDASELLATHPELAALEITLELRMAARVDDPQLSATKVEAVLHEIDALERRRPDMVAPYLHATETLAVRLPHLLPPHFPKRLVERAPDYARGRLLAWVYVLKTDTRPWEQRRDALKAEIEHVLAERADDPEWLDTVAEGYRLLGEEEPAAQIDDRILREHPQTEFADRVQYRRVRLGREGLASVRDPKERRVAEQAWADQAQAFLDRPQPGDPGLNPNVAMMLFEHYAHAEGVDPAERKAQLLAVVPKLHEGFVDNPHFVYLVAPRLLVDATDDFATARALASLGLEGMKQYHEAFRRGRTTGELERAVDLSVSRVHETLGWIARREGATDQATARLQQAVELDPDNGGAWLELGTIARERGDFEQAERWLVRAYGDPVPETQSKAKAQLAALYASDGSTEDVDARLRRARKQIRDEQRAEALATRKHGPETIDVHRVEPLPSGPPLPSLDGKIVVVDVWATWCGPCVAEMPTLARVWKESYRDDPDVALLTVSVDDNPEVVRRFLERTGYQIPAFHDRGFAKRMGVRGYPTRLFFDKSGQLAFVQMSRGAGLEDELGWRVDALR